MHSHECLLVIIVAIRLFRTLLVIANITNCCFLFVCITFNIDVK